MSDNISLDAMAFFFAWSYKVTTLVIGYLFARLGYTLFLQGVKGEFNFGMEIKGAKATLVSASPGLFLILMGTVIVGVGLYKGLNFQVTRTPPPAAAVSQPLRSMPEPAERYKLPAMPPPKE